MTLPLPLNAFDPSCHLYAQLHAERFPNREIRVESDNLQFSYRQVSFAEYHEALTRSRDKEDGNPLWLAYLGRVLRVADLFLEMITLGRGSSIPSQEVYGITVACLDALCYWDAKWIKLGAYFSVYKIAYAARVILAVIPLPYIGTLGEYLCDNTYYHRALQNAVRDEWRRQANLTPTPLLLPLVA